MKKILSLCLILLWCTTITFAWWDPGHLVTAMIAYEQLDPAAKKKVDELVKVLQRDYPYVNHFIATGPWPDDLKAEGVRTYDTWHYTNLPLNSSRLPLADPPVIDIIWAINQMTKVLKSEKPRAVDQARHLAFLVHLVADLHQPLHSTSVHDDEHPSGNAGGNGFSLKGEWRNMHSLWDDGCGYLTAYNDINPYGTAKDALEKSEVSRIKQLAKEITKEFPSSYFTCKDQLDPDFWALESHKLAIKHGYRGINEVKENGYNKWIQEGDTPSDLYLKNGQQVVKERLALAGYRLGSLLNEIFAEDK